MHDAAVDGRRGPNMLPAPLVPDGFILPPDPYGGGGHSAVVVASKLESLVGEMIRAHTGQPDTSGKKSPREVLAFLPWFTAVLSVPAGQYYSRTQG